MKKLIAFLSLFTSFTTLICCALPALFVVLGFGAAFAGLVSALPSLVWISEKKIWLFGLGAIMLITAGLLQYQNRRLECTTDGDGTACSTARDWSRWVYWASVGLYGIGVFFSFLAPKLFE